MSEIIENAESSYESLKYLLETTLASSDFQDALGDLDTLANPMRAIKELENFEAAYQDPRISGRSFKCAALVRCKGCDRYFEAEGEESLLDLVAVAEAHECSAKARGDEVAQDEVTKAWEAVQRAHKDAVGLNIFDTKTWAVAAAMQNYVHTVVKAERDRVSESYRNSGIMDTPDLDALDKLVDLTEPGRDGR